jgi:hypothetical protein
MHSHDSESLTTRCSLSFVFFFLTSIQGVFAKNLTVLKQDLVSTISQEIGVLKKSVTTNGVDLTTIKAELNASCGRHCYQGEFASTPCGPNQKTVCSACQSGTFSVGGLPVECTPCTDCSKQSAYESAECSTTKDTGCKPCAVCGTNKWAKNVCTDDSNAHCQTHSTCPSTHFKIASGTPTSDTKCQKAKICEAKKFYQTKVHTTSADSECTKCTVCASAMRTECGATTDRQCGPFLFSGKLSGDNWEPFMWYVHVYLI